MTSPASSAATTTAATAAAAGRFSAGDLARLVVILSAAFMVVLDFFIVIVALPAIGESLRATPAQLQLIVAGYALTNAATLIAGGRLGDLFGRRRMFLVGSAAFAAASVACGLAPSATALVLLRFVQGVAGGVLHPQVLALLGLHFTGARRSRAFAWYAMAMGLAGISGQLLGGTLVDADLAGLGWRSCFLINAPVGLLAIAGALALIDERGALGSGRIDWVGMLLAAATLLALITPLSIGREQFGVATNLALLLVAGVLAALFWKHQHMLERARASPMLGPSLLRVPGFRWGVTTVLGFYMGVASFYLILGLHLQGTLGMEPSRSGLLFAIMGCSYFAASLVAPRLREALGEWLLWLGALVLAVGHLLQAAAVLWLPGEATLVAALVVEGAGIGLVMGPLLAAALARVPPDRAGVAAGVISTMQSTGNALGVAFVSTIYFAAAHGARGSSGHGFAVALIVLAVLAAGVSVQCAGAKPD